MIQESDLVRFWISNGNKESEKDRQKFEHDRHVRKTWGPSIEEAAKRAKSREKLERDLEQLRRMGK